MMKKGRNWLYWPCFGLSNQGYIARYLEEPFPCNRKDFENDEEITGPIFKIDVWGVKEPK